MKKYSKVIALVISTVMMSVSVPAFAAVDVSGAIPVNEQNILKQFSDDFTYENTGNLSGQNVSLGNGNWRSKTEAEGAMHGENALGTYESQFGITEGRLQLYGSSVDTTGHEKNYAQTADTMPALVWTGGLEAENQQIHIDVNKGSKEMNWAVRFLVQENGDGYTLGFRGTYTKNAKAWELYKTVNGEVKTLVSSDATINMETAQAGLDISYIDGKISFKVAYDGEENYLSGSYVDEEPFDLTGKSTTVWLLSGWRQSDTGTWARIRCNYFDNFSMKEYVPYISGSFPQSYTHFDVAKGKTVDGDGVLDLGAQYRLRSFEIAALEGKKNIYVSGDKRTWEVLEDADFDANGAWMNTRSAQAYRYVYIEGVDLSDVTIWTDIVADEVVETVIKTPVVLDANLDGVTDDGVIWTVEPVIAGEVVNGVFTPLIKGDAVLTAAQAENPDTKTSVTLKVLGEIEIAIKNGTEAEYLTGKQPLLQALRTSLDETNGSLDAFKGIMRNTGEQKIEELIDLESTGISAMSDEEMESYYQRLKSYDSALFVCDEIQDINNVISCLETEYALKFVCNVTDTEVLKQNIAMYNTYYQLPLEEVYYTENQEACLQQLLSTNWKNMSEFKNVFCEQYVLTGLDKALSTTMVQTLLADLQSEIGYDASLYATRDKEALAAAILENKATLNTVEALRSFINTYQPTDTDNNQSSNGGSSSNGNYFGGGGGFAGGGFAGGSSIFVDTEIVKESISAPEPIEPKEIFSDFNEEHWAFETVIRARSRGIANGYEDGSFRPENKITRSEFVKLLVQAFGIEIISDDPCSFADVTENMWHYEYVNAAFQNGLVKGDENNCFNPEQEITREEICTMIARVIPHAEPGIIRRNEIVFTDKESISDWAEDAVVWMAVEEMVSGMPDGSFAPQGNATRAEAVTMIIRALDWSEGNE